MSCATYLQKYNVKESGMYYVYFVNCKASGLGRVTIDGKVTFMNPYGYLNGEMYYYMPVCMKSFLLICYQFYLSLAIFYFLFVIVWLVLSFKHRRLMLTLQNCIAGVIFLGFIEALTLYFDDLGYNISGENCMTIFLHVMIFFRCWRHDYGCYREHCEENNL